LLLWWVGAAALLLLLLLLSLPLVTLLALLLLLTTCTRLLCTLRWALPWPWVSASRIPVSWGFRTRDNAALLPTIEMHVGLFLSLWLLWQLAMGSACSTWPPCSPCLTWCTPLLVSCRASLTLLKHNASQPRRTGEAV
jgi:hypothetical protein